MSEIIFKDNRDRKQRLQILFENEQFIIVNKTPFLPVIPDRYSLYKHSLVSLMDHYVKKHDPENRPYVVHRIDANTSGVLILAKNSNAHRDLNDLFEKKQVEKTYWAIVNGGPYQDTGEINLPLKSGYGKTPRMVIDKNGKAATTFYTVLERFRHYSLVEVKPITGRTHQIRVHLKSIGCPISVDPLYGNRSRFDLSMIKKNYHHKDDDEPRPLCDRLTLHAYKVAFKNPQTNEQFEFTAPLPKDFKAVLKALRKWDLQAQK